MRQSSCVRGSAAAWCESTALARTTTMTSAQGTSPSKQITMIVVKTMVERQVDPWAKVIKEARVAPQ